uniref:Uncharacterized protein n=1 Tax=Avena sativa TaxID=4498 RepID=A0ACD5V8T0_AVESA
MDIRSWFMSRQSKFHNSWGKSDDCCSWEGITCDNGTRRISRLKLSQIPFSDEYWNMSLAMFSPFRELQLLDFAWNSACLQNFEGLEGLSKLKYLDLSYNCLLEGIPGSVGKLISLEVINFNGNYACANLHNTGFQNLHNLRNLRELHLGSNLLRGSLPASLFALPFLEYLDLSDNLFEGKIHINSSSNLHLKINSNHLELRNISSLSTFIPTPNGFLPTSLFTLPCLEHLDLSHNVLSGSIPTSVFLLPCLEYLDLAHNFLQGHIPINSSWNLRELDFRSNQLSGNLPASLFALPSLKYVDFSKNLLQGHIPINSSWKCSSLLQTIRLSENKLSGKFDFFWLRKCMNLELIDLSGNTGLVVQLKLHGWVPKFQLKTLKLSSCNLHTSMIMNPHFLHTQRYLEILDLSNNNLSGRMPNWLFTNEAALAYLDLSNNSLVGSLDLIWQHQTSLELLDISLNLVEGHLPKNIGLMFPNLFFLDVSHNNISGRIPSSLCNIVAIRFLHLSNNKLRGDVPSCLFTHTIIILKLSNNCLGGKILDGVSDFSNMWQIYLDNNKFEGTLSRNFSGNLQVMDLHGNSKISGELDTSLWNLPNLKVLSLASNGLTGDIHPRICNLTRLRLLDLSSNYFTGHIPNCSSTLPLEFLSVSENSLSGFPSDFFTSSYITVLDLSHNQFTGNLEWTYYLSIISVLLLSNNKFGGQISPNLCHLQHLSIIDISHNILWGSIQSCIGGIPFENPDAYEYNWPTIIYAIEEVLDDYFSYSSQYELQGFNFTTKRNRYTYGRNFFMSMSGIDFSANMLSGDIPKEMGNLSHVKSLNLSNNFFTGSIPTTFAKLSEIESLDLSENKLNGSIPWQLTRLSSLEVFSVAYNDLSGCLPESGQFGAFDMDCYSGNKNLISCTDGSGPVVWNGTVGNASDDSDPILYVVSAVSFVLAFWATVTFVFCHSFGQRAILKWATGE